MPKRIQWTPVAKKPYTESIARAISAAGSLTAASVEDVGELAACVAMTMPPVARNDFLARLSSNERTVARSWLKGFENGRIEAGLLALEEIFTQIASDRVLHKIEKSRNNDRTHERLRQVSFDAFIINPQSLIGLCAGRFSFLNNFKSSSSGAWLGVCIFGQIREQYEPGCNYTKLVQGVIDDVMSGKGFCDIEFKAGKCEEALKGFYDLAMLAKG